MTLEPEIVIATVGILLANAAAIASVFINLNVKIAENAKDLLSLKNDMEEHKTKNRDDIKELKELMLRDKAENRDDHKAIIIDLATLSKNFSDFRVELIRLIQKQK
jgi:hypothetical protein